MEQSDFDHYKKHAEIVNGILNDLKQHGSKGHVTGALTPFVRRMTQSVQTLVFLFSGKYVGEPEFDGAMILRGVYDAHVQALYILKDPVRRATLYRDFQWIERHKLKAILAQGKSRLAQELTATTPASPTIDQEYQRVKGRYITKNGKTQMQWYAGTLADLARDIGYEDEYSLLGKTLNGVVHTSYLALNSPHHLSGEALIDQCWVLIYRVLAKIVDYSHFPVETQKAGVTVIW